ncbi:MAG: hypothetical protein JSS66_05235 [Armatimonadetes bacterium]|nr:hypothetical protein [Armatimonadota bacterium]
MKKPSNWDNLFLIEGEPCNCGLALAAVCDSLAATPLRIKSDVAALKNACMAYPISGQRQVVIVANPDSDTATAMGQLLDTGALRAPGLVAIFSDGYGDRRNGFVAKAHKLKRVYEYSYHLVDDPVAFKAYLSDWEERAGIKIAVKAKPWLLEHAPVRKASVRGVKGSKEEIIYDVPALESDLNKLAVLLEHEGRDVINTDDLEDGVYRSTLHSQWDFCDAFALGKPTMFALAPKEQNYVGLMRMLASQCLFMLQVRAQGDVAIQRPEDAAKHIGGNALAQKYSFDNDKSEGYKTLHPYRVKMAAKKLQNVSMERLLGLVSLCEQASLDMLRGFSQEAVFTMTLLAACGQQEYVPFSS